MGFVNIDGLKIHYHTAGVLFEGVKLCRTTLPYLAHSTSTKKAA